MSARVYCYCLNKLNSLFNRNNNKLWHARMPLRNERQLLVLASGSTYYNTGTRAREEQEVDAAFVQSVTCFSRELIESGWNVRYIPANDVFELALFVGHNRRQNHQPHHSWQEFHSSSLRIISR